VLQSTDQTPVSYMHDHILLYRRSANHCFNSVADGFWCRNVGAPHEISFPIGLDNDGILLEFTDALNRKA
jgi:hypothetical protein